MEVEHDSLLFRKNADDTKMDKKRPCPLRPLHIRPFQANSIHINHSISKASSRMSQLIYRLWPIHITRRL